MKPPPVAACIAALLTAAAAFLAGIAGGAPVESWALWACAILTVGGLLAGYVLDQKKKSGLSYES